MIRVLREEILQIVKNKYEQYTEEYGEENIVGVYACGSPLYGNCKSINEVAWVIIYRLPIEYMLKFSDDMEYSPLEETDILYKVEDYFELIYSDPFYLMETLYTPYCKENFYYKEILENIKNIRNSFFLCNLGSKVNEKKALINDLIRSYEESQDRSFLKEAIRINYFLKKFDFCKDYGSSIVLDNNALLFWESSSKKFSNLNIEKFKKEVKFFQIRIEEKKELCEQKYEELRSILFKFWSVNKPIKEEPPIMEGKNLDIKLTLKEKEALEVLLQEIPNSEGTVILKELVEKTNISRPVFKNLLNKISDLILIKSLGYKGSHISFLDREACEMLSN